MQKNLVEGGISLVVPDFVQFAASAGADFPASTAAAKPGLMQKAKFVVVAAADLDLFETVAEAAAYLAVFAVEEVPGCPSSLDWVNRDSHSFQYLNVFGICSETCLKSFFIHILVCFFFLIE